MAEVDADVAGPITGITDLPAVQVDTGAEEGVAGGMVVLSMVVVEQEDTAADHTEADHTEIGGKPRH